MPYFLVRCREVHVVVYEIEADSREHAEAKAENGIDDDPCQSERVYWDVRHVEEVQ